MNSLQEKALVSAVLSPFSDQVILELILLRMIDFSKLSERTIHLIWLLFNEDKIIEKIPTRYIKNGWWYDECKICCLKGCKVCETEDCGCEDCVCKDCELKNCICTCSDFDANNSDSDFDASDSDFDA